MRLSIETQILFLALLAVTPGQSLLQLGASRGIVALGTSLATLLMLGSGIVSTSVRVPLVVLGPLRFPLPVVLGLKGLGYVKLRRMLNKRQPVRTGRIRPSTATATPADSTRSSAGKASSRRTKKTRVGTSAATETRYQQRLKELTDTLPVAAIGKTFRYVEVLDEEDCIVRVTCELTVDPAIAGGIGEQLLTFLTSLDSSDQTAPWIKYQNAVRTGKVAGSRKACQRKFNRCTQSTKAIVAEARKKLIGAMM